MGVVASGELSPHPAATRATPSAATASALTVPLYVWLKPKQRRLRSSAEHFPLECVGHEFESESRITASASLAKREPLDRDVGSRAASYLRIEERGLASSS